MWYSAKCSKISLRQFKIVSLLNNNTDDVGDSLYFINITCNFRCCHPYLLFIFPPITHFGSPFFLSNLPYDSINAFKCQLLITCPSLQVPFLMS